MVRWWLILYYILHSVCPFLFVSALFFACFLYLYAFFWDCVCCSVLPSANRKYEHKKKTRNWLPVIWWRRKITRRKWPHTKMPKIYSICYFFRLDKAASFNRIHQNCVWRRFLRFFQLSLDHKFSTEWLANGQGVSNIYIKIKHKLYKWNLSNRPQRTIDHCPFHRN